VLSGAGGNLRDELPSEFERARTTAWAVQAHALLVEVAGDELRMTPVSGLLPDGSFDRMTAQTPSGDTMAPPFVVQR
jgi:tartrate-resistant acid phosphatase type 5